MTAPRWLWRSPSVRLALAAFGVSSGMFVWALREAIRLEHVSAAAAARSTDGTPETEARPAVYSLERVLKAVAKDPFHPERRRPGARFRFPTGRGSPVARRQRPLPTEASLRLIGTAVAPDGGFAMCAWQGGTPRIVRVGDRVGEWTLKKVTPGTAEFATPAGTTIVVRMPKGGRGE